MNDETHVSDEEIERRIEEAERNPESNVDARELLQAVEAVRAAKAVMARVTGVFR